MEGGIEGGREGGKEGGKEISNPSEASGTVGHHLGGTSSNVELRNYVISRHNFSNAELRNYVILAKYPSVGRVSAMVLRCH